MKVLKLRFKNINSLKGEHLIDFTLPPLSETGIFAIVGPTGAGKSTLLDAITLGLYGRVPRMEKVTKSMVEGKGSVVTHHQGEAWVEVTYKSREEVYVSRWGIRKTNRGNWADYAMELSRYRDGEILEDKKSDVPKLNEQLIGLNYKQFIKSILLSQGEFARFLRANHHERGALLEELTGTHIYREIGKAVYNKHKQLEAEIKLAESRISDIDLLDESSHQQLEEQARASQDRALQLKMEMDEIQTWINYKKDKEKLQLQLHDNKEEQRQLEEKRSDFKASALKLKRHLAIAPYMAEWRELNRLKIHQKSLLEKALMEESLIKEATKQKEELVKALSKLVGEAANEEDFQEHLSRFVDQVKEYDIQLVEIKKRGAEQRGNLDEAINQGEFPLSASLQVVKDPEQLQSMVQDRLSTLSLSEHSDQELIQRYEDYSKDVRNLDEYHRIIADTTLLKEQVDKVDSKLSEIGKSIIETGNEKQNREKEEVDLSNRVEVLRKQKDEHIKITSLEDHRLALEDGEPCPLCGSLEHPYALHDSLKKYVSIDLHLETAQAQQKEVQSKILDLTSKEAELNQSLKNTSKRKQELQLQMNNLKAQLVELRQKASGLNFSDWTNKEALQKRADELKEELLVLKTQLDHRNEYRYLQSISQINRAMQTTLEAYVSLQKKRNLIYTGKDIDADSKPLRDSFSEANNSISKHTHILAESRKEEMTTQTSIRELEVRLNKEAQKNEYKDIEEMSQHFLSESDFQELNAIQVELDKKEVSLNDAAIKLEKQKLELKPLPKADERSLEELKSIWETVNKERDTINERLGSINQQLKNYKEQVQKFEKALSALEDKKGAFRKWQLLNNLIGDASGNKHANFAQELTLQTLIALANERLDKLTDRYLLAPPIQSEEELRVIDRYQGNIPRSTLTLSGGETFIISLALALSLSDLASRNVRLESLFIDEGFGTLDYETLEVALSTLDNLQAESNKTIGVISHVEALKERINTQIKLEKGTSGYSTLSVV